MECVPTVGLELSVNLHAVGKSSMFYKAYIYDVNLCVPRKDWLNMNSCFCILMTHIYVFNTLLELEYDNTKEHKARCFFITHTYIYTC